MTDRGHGTRPYDLLAMVMPLGKALRAMEDRVAARHGLTMWQYAILLAVGARPAITQGAAAARIGYSKNRIIGDLDRLEALALVTRAPGPDRRANALTLTDRGAERARVIQADIQACEDDLLAVLDEPARSTLHAALAKLTSRVHDGPWLADWLAADADAPTGL